RVDSFFQKKFDAKNPEIKEDGAAIDCVVSLFKEYSELFGFKVARDDLTKVVKNQLTRFGITKGYLILLKSLPEGVMEDEKIQYFKRDELEETIRKRTKELEEARAILEKRIQERTLELEAERNKFRVVLYNTFDGVFAVDRQGRVISFNKSIEDLTGYQESDVLGNIADDYIKLYDRDNNPVGIKNYFPFLKIVSDKSIYKTEGLILKGRKGKQHIVSLVSSVVSESGDSNVGCIVTIHDVTHERELESMKLDFVSIAAHELRTPLTAIRGYLSVLLDELSGKISNDHRVYLERSYLSANQLFVLVENLLNVSRIERGNVQLSKEVIEWSPFVEQVVQSFRPLANERKVKLSFLPMTSPSKVEVDPVMIGEVLANLLDNAIRYTDEGGGVLVFMELSDKFMITHIKDSGQGIPKESIPHLFTKFYRVSGVLGQGSKGTGLGLYISKEIVKLHGGEIWVESSVGQGSVFSFTVPKAK
ncbi:PAS domain S-box protein, partial [candidate division WWE3 bacterium]|nr:PAS domain S-box protein [candidate division WWE3 bacterium]